MSLKKISLFISILLIGFLLLIFLFLSPIAKYVIESNSEEWMGRKVKIESLWINIFSGSIHIEKFRMHENKSEKVFVGFDDFYCNIAMLKLFSGEYVVSPIALTKPQINIVQNGAKFNFDDLLIRFSDTTQKPADPATEPLKYFISEIAIAGGAINYTTTAPIVTVSINQLNISSLPVSYLDSIYNIQTDFSILTGGKMNARLNFNAESMAYLLDLKIEKLKLNYLAAYMRDFLRVKTFNAAVNTDIKVSGNFKKPQEVAAKGTMEVNGFSIVDTTGDELTFFESYKMGIDSLNTKAGIYNFSYIELNNAFVKFGIYDDGTNFDRVLVEEEIDTVSAAPVASYSNIFQMMAGYIKSLSMEYLLNEYSVEKLSLNNAHIVFTDYTLEDKFKYDLDSMCILSDNLNSKNERILISLTSRLNNSGIMTGSLSINPDGFEDMDIHYEVKNLLISDINPYSKYYVATPFINGTVLFVNNTTIVNNKLKSTNKLFIEKIKVGGKSGLKGLYDVPIKLAVSILRDPKGNIDFEIPVEGDLNDPKFKIGKVIWTVFKNLIIKAATAPYNLIAQSFGGKEEDYKEIGYEYLQKGLSNDQVRILSNLIKLLKEKPDIGIEFVQLNNKEDEKEQLALYKTKKEFLNFTADSLTTEQYQQLIALSNKDSVFIDWINKKTGAPSNLLSIQDKCIKHIGNENLVLEVNAIMEQRNTFLLSYFANNGVAAERIKISNIKKEDQATKESRPRYLINIVNYESAEVNSGISNGNKIK